MAWALARPEASVRGEHQAGWQQGTQTDRQTGKDREKDRKWFEAAATSWRAVKKRLEVNLRKAEGR